MADRLRGDLDCIADCGREAEMTDNYDYDANFESISKQLAAATTHEEIEAIREICPHPSFDLNRWSGIYTCRLCGRLFDSLDDHRETK